MVDQTIETMKRKVVKAINSLETACPNLTPLISVAPGRINLIGGHTDYNGGFVLPLAINRYVVVALRPRSDRLMRAVAADTDEKAIMDLSFEDTSLSMMPKWMGFCVGAWRIISETDAGKSKRLPGFDIAFSGDVPVGAGLSSSAALSVALLTAINHSAGLKLEPFILSTLAPEIEARYAGVRCGLMDPFTSAMGKAGHVVFLDNAQRRYQYFPLPTDKLAVVSIFTGVKHELASSSYNAIRALCERTAEELLGEKGAYLSNVSNDLFRLKHHSLDADQRRIVRHILTENRRVLLVCEGLKELAASKTDEPGKVLGRLLYHSHASLKNDYRVSCDELDVIVHLAAGFDGAYGSRMTGGGFGGATVNLVRPDRVDAFIDVVLDGYKKATGIDGTAWRFEPVDGARIIGA